MISDLYRYEHFYTMSNNFLLIGSIVQFFQTLQLRRQHHGRANIVLNLISTKLRVLFEIACVKVHFGYNPLLSAY